ncbi:hypothetical protein DXG01_008994 [Tephrocybe rancida]|nr:hypothetical protein DXG01_008994 [Tephrocybe rancida]
MDPDTPSSEELPSPGAIIAPPGTSIQVAADTILGIIEKERKDAAHASHLRYLQLEQHFASYRESANAAVAAEHAQLSDTHQKLVATQVLLVQYQRMHAIDARSSAVVPLFGQRQIEAGPYVSQQTHDAEVYRAAQREENSAKQRLKELQNALRDVGIVFSSEDNSLRFEAGWATVLAQLEARDFGIMNAGRLHEVLGQLTHRLQHDRETIEQLEQRVLTLESEKAQIIDKYELELQVSKLEISLLHEAATTPNSSLTTTTTTTTTIDSTTPQARNPSGMAVPGTSSTTCVAPTDLMIARASAGKFRVQALPPL